MKKHTLIGTAALLALTAAGFAWAQPGDGGPGGRGGRGGFDPEQRIERMKDRLDLTDDQAEAIEKIHSEGKAERTAIQKELRRLRNQIEGEMLKDNVNTQTVVRLTKQAGDKRTEMQVMSVQQMLKVREVLTPEQREKFMAMHGERGGKGGHGRGHGRGPGPGPGR